MGTGAAWSDLLLDSDQDFYVSLSDIQDYFLWPGHTVGVVGLLLSGRDQLVGGDGVGGAESWLRGHVLDA